MPVSLRNALVVRGETLYAPTEDDGPSHIVAMDARTGEVRWRSDVAGRGYLAADDGGVYFLASGPGGLTELVALDPRTGAVRWRYGPSEAGRSAAAPGRSPAGEPLARPFCRPAAIEGGRVAWTSGAAVHLLDASDGRPIWVRPLAGEGLVSAPAADGEGLLVASAGAVYRLALETGEVVWRRPLAGVAMPPAPPRLGEARPLVEAGGGRVFVAVRQRNNRDRLVALDPAREAELWALDLPPVFHLLARSGRLYVRGEGVLALDAPSGRRLWTRQAQGCGPTTVAEPIVYFVDTADRGRLVAAGAHDGRDVWQVPGVQSCEPMVLAGGMGFLKSSDGVLRAMALAGPR
jgi:outer membrane protein assembly factor BamB